MYRILERAGDLSERSEYLLKNFLVYIREKVHLWEAFHQKIWNKTFDTVSMQFKEISQTNQQNVFDQEMSQT